MWDDGQSVGEGFLLSLSTYNIASSTCHTRHVNKTPGKPLNHLLLSSYQCRRAVARTDIYIYQRVPAPVLRSIGSVLGPVLSPDQCPPYRRIGHIHA